MDQSKGAAEAEDKRAVRIAQQFREAHNMTYELDCFGTPLIVRVFPLDGATVEWRIEARTSDAPDAVVATATAPTREEALRSVAQRWQDHRALHVLPNVDWDAIAQAMTAVRAL
jgi:hypothetical protein